MLKVLIVTYYWPPSGGSSVLRWLKFVKYLRDYGWEPVVYTPSNPEPQEIDHSLLKDIPVDIEIITSPIREPYTLYKWLTGKKKDDRLGVAFMTESKKPGLISRFSLWIRSNLFIPDPRRLWVRPSVRILCKYLKQNPADVIVTTGPPHSMHLIGLGLKRKLGVRWVADFRDPWTNIDFYRDLALTPLADSIHKKLEKEVLLTADQVITVSPGMTREFITKGAKHVITIPNGYDGEPIRSLKHESDRFTFVHLGSMPKSRNPEVLWQALSDLSKEDTRFASCLQVKLIGKVDLNVKESIETYGLREFVLFEDYIPHHQTMSLLAGAGVLLLCINNSSNAQGILTNKFYEYLCANRPILAVGPEDGDAAAILAETGTGKIFGYDDASGLKIHLIELFTIFNKLVVKPEYWRFSRKKLTRDLVNLNKLVI
jgi:glycosyltransferase involved in cell wall biosynthesis